MKFAGINLNEPRIMGVINVSPESFYKGSVRNDEEKLIETTLRMVEEGASFIDIGAKSTAPPTWKLRYRLRKRLDGRSGQ